jgi:hypothetical protein
MNAVMLAYGLAEGGTGRRAGVAGPVLGTGGEPGAHGVLAPNTKLRPEIIPSSGRQAGNVPVPGFPSARVNANTPQRTTVTRPLPRRLPV